MPKILEDVRGQLLDETRRQLGDRTYGEMTIRSIARACGLGLGTVYNYFPSKEALIAAVLLEEWQGSMSRLTAVVKEDTEPADALLAVWEALSGFLSSNGKLFGDARARETYAAVSAQYHARLIDSLAAPLERICAARAARDDCAAGEGSADPAFTARFLAENLLRAAVSGQPFAPLSQLLLRII